MFKFTLILVGLCIVAGIAFLLRARQIPSRAPQRQATTKTNAPIYADLRTQALTGSRAAFGLDATSPDAPAWGVLMETGFPEGTATLVSMSDGSASLYFSGGGGVIGGSGHESVRRVAAAFVRLAGTQQAGMIATKAFPLPRTGRTVFYVLTDSGVFSADADENDLGEQRHTLSPLFYAGQEVITQLRLVADMK
jgi:hypothetical protein